MEHLYLYFICQEMKQTSSKRWLKHCWPLPLCFLFGFPSCNHSYHNKEIVKCYSAEEQAVSLHSHLWAAPSGSWLIPAAPGSLPHRLPVRNPAGVTSELESPDSKTCSSVLVFGCRIMAHTWRLLGLHWLRSMPGQIWPVPSWGTMAYLRQGL